MFIQQQNNQYNRQVFSGSLELATERHIWCVVSLIVLMKWPLPTFLILDCFCNCYVFFFLFQSKPTWIKWPKFSPFFQTISHPSGAQHKAHRHQSLFGERTALWYRTVQVSNISWPLLKKTTTAARWRGRMVLTRKKSVLLWKVSFGNKICS